MLKYAGAAYLIHLGIRALSGSAVPDLRRRAEPISPWRTFRDGVLVNLLNPKVALFFLAFLPQLVAPGPNTRTHMLVLGGIFFTIALALDVMYALAGGAVSAWLRSHPRALDRQHYAVGSAYLVLGAVAALPAL